MARHFIICFVCSNIVFYSLGATQSALATSTTDQLQQVFGSPEDFITKFESTVKDKSDEIIGLLIATFGFSLVIKLL